MVPGQLALVLHAHLPFVRHPEHDDFLEESWLFEAVVETYLPLLEVFDRLERDRVPFSLTLTLTPTLCAMLADPLLQARTQRYLDRVVELAEGEIGRTATEEDSRPHATAMYYRDRLRSLRAQYHDHWNGDLVGAYRGFQDRGQIEIITCAATHGFLPLMANHAGAVRAQIRVACADYERHFGRRPRGIWLPECAYFTGLDRELAAAELRWFVLDAHGVLLARPRPHAAMYAPGFTPAGPAVFGRDREASRQVWSGEIGYPGDPRYRDFYRDVGFDLPLEQLSPVIPKGAPRRFTGLKYHRVTGRKVGLKEKDFYRRDDALDAVQSHAAHFLDSRLQQMARLGEAGGVAPIVVVPFDAELFGHWWYEGPEFLEAFFRAAARSETGLKLTTPSRYLTENPTQQVLDPSPSSWGQNGYWEVWLQPRNAWIYRHLQAAAQRMTELAKQHRGLQREAPLLERALRQMARELLLAQASDWAFLLKTGTASEYANRRTRTHLSRFHRLAKSVAHGEVNVMELERSESRDNLFPELDWRVFAEP
jgi:1,4-alpha-glucan branching enzyme